MDRGVIRLVAGEVQLLEQLERDPHGRSRKPTWELASALGHRTDSTTVQRLRRLEHKGLVRKSWQGAAAWWTLTERGREALEIDRAMEANNQRSSPEPV